MVNDHEIKLSVDTKWAFRKPSTKMQNAHTRMTAYTFTFFFVFYNWSTKKTELTVFSKTNRNLNRTEPAEFLKTEPNLKNSFHTSTHDPLTSTAHIVYRSTCHMHSDQTLSTVTSTPAAQARPTLTDNILTTDGKCTRIYIDRTLRSTGSGYRSVIKCTSIKLSVIAYCDVCRFNIHLVTRVSSRWPWQSKMS